MVRGPTTKTRRPFAYEALGGRYRDSASHPSDSPSLPPPRQNPPSSSVGNEEQPIEREEHAVIFLGRIESFNLAGHLVQEKITI